MGPTRTVKSSTTRSKNTKGLSKPNASGASKSKVSKKTKAPPPKQQKTKSTIRPIKKKRKTYTDQELGVPKLNMITPVGIGLPQGKKKGKVFVDDQESMMTILAIVNADKEGQIESKLMKSRQMEEIREARRKQAESRQEQRRLKLEETKDAMRKKRKRKLDVAVEVNSAENASKAVKAAKPGRKRVSFA